MAKPRTPYRTAQESAAALPPWTVQIIKEKMMADRRYDDPIESALWGDKRKEELQDEYFNRFRFDLEGKEEENRRRVEEWEDNMRRASSDPGSSSFPSYTPLPWENPPNIGDLPGQIIEPLPPEPPIPVAQPVQGPMDYPNNLPPPGQNPFGSPSLPHMPPFAPLPDKPRGPR